MTIKFGDLIATWCFSIERLCESLATGGLPPFDSCGVLGPFAGDVVGRPGLVKTSALLYVGGP